MRMGSFRTNLDLADVAWRGRSNRRSDVRDRSPHESPSRVAEDDDGEPPARHVLLISQVAISGEEYVESRGFRRQKQLAVSQSVPTE